MKIVFTQPIPTLIKKWLEQDFYDHEAVEGTISATTLLRPVREIVLTEKHWDQIEVEGIDRMWSLFGSGVHAVLEKIEGCPAPDRLYHQIDGMKISGKPDVVKANLVTDFKTTSAWTLVYNSREWEWKMQLSIYRWLYHHDKKIDLKDTGAIIAILRDWAERDSKALNYPKAPIVEIKVPLYSLEETEAFVRGRIKEIKAARKKLPLCTDEERWYNAKKDRFMKCDRYCNARKFCEQAEEEQSKKGA